MVKGEKSLSEGVDNDLKTFKSSVNSLFFNSHSAKDEPHISEYNDLFNKDTFVVSEKDLEMLNDDVQKHMIYDDDYDDDDDDYYDDNYNDEYDDDYKNEDYDHSSEVNNEKQKEENDDSETNFDYYKHKDIETQSNKPPDKQNDKYYDEHIHHEPVKKLLPDNINDLIDSDEELDNTHFLYDPPIKYKDKILIYLIKSMPVLIIGILIFFLTGMISNDKLPVVSKFNTNLNPFLTHKLYVLEEDIKSLKKIENLGLKVTNLQTEIEILKDHVDKIQINSQPGINSNGLINDIFDKMSKLESNVESLSKIVTQELLNKEESKEMKQAQIKNALSLPSIPKQISSKYFNIANKCQILRQLTSYPPINRIKRRKTISSRIIHGFPDFIKRIWNSKSQLSNNNNSSSSIKTLGDIKLLSSSNSPKNALIENPTLFWQNLASNIPIYYTLTIDDPIRLHEIGIYHSRQPPLFSKLNNTNNHDIKKRWINTAPKNIEILVRPIDSQFTEMKSEMSKHFNQDIKFKIHKGSIHSKPDNWKNWIRVGDFEYDINLNRAYQTLPWSVSAREILSKYYVRDVMFIIHSNWDDEIVILDTVRIFQLDDENKEHIEDETEVIFLGEEPV